MLDILRLFQDHSTINHHQLPKFQQTTLSEIMGMTFEPKDKGTNVWSITSPRDGHLTRHQLAVSAFLDLANNPPDLSFCEFLERHSQATWLQTGTMQVDWGLQRQVTIQKVSTKKNMIMKDPSYAEIPQHPPLLLSIKARSMMVGFKVSQGRRHLKPHLWQTDWWHVAWGM